MNAITKWTKTIEVTAVLQHKSKGCKVIKKVIGTEPLMCLYCYIYLALSFVILYT